MTTVVHSALLSAPIQGSYNKLFCATVHLLESYQVSVYFARLSIRKCIIVLFPVSDSAPAVSVCPRARQTYLNTESLFVSARNCMYMNVLSLLRYGHLLLEL